MGDIIVQKYGGSSVATTEKIITIAKRLIERKKTNPKIVVVVSAMGDTTDDYICRSPPAPSQSQAVRQQESPSSPVRRPRLRRSRG